MERSTSGANPNVNHGLWAMMICQWGFTSCNKGNTCVKVGGGGGCARMGVRGIWEILAPSPQFCCEPNTALKLKVY